MGKSGRKRPSPFNVSDDADIALDQLEAAEAVFASKERVRVIGDIRAPREKQASVDAGTAAHVNKRRRPRQVGGCDISASAPAKLTQPSVSVRSPACAPSFARLSVPTPAHRILTPDPSLQAALQRPAWVLRSPSPLSPQHQPETPLPRMHASPGLHLKTTDTLSSLNPLEKKSAPTSAPRSNPVKDVGIAETEVTRQMAAIDFVHVFNAGAFPGPVESGADDVTGRVAQVRTLAMAGSQSPEWSTGSRSEMLNKLDRSSERKNWSRRRSSAGFDGAGGKQPARSGAEFDSLNRSSRLDMHLHKAEVGGLYKEPNNNPPRRLKEQGSRVVIAAGTPADELSPRIHATAVNISRPGHIHARAALNVNSHHATPVTGISSHVVAKNEKSRKTKTKVVVMEIRDVIPRLAREDFLPDVKIAPQFDDPTEVEIIASPIRAISASQKSIHEAPLAYESRERRRSRRLSSRLARRVAPDEVIDLTQGIDNDDTAPSNSEAFHEPFLTGSERKTQRTKPVKNFEQLLSQGPLEPRGSGIVNGEVVPACGPVDFSYIEPPMLKELTATEKELVEALTKGNEQEQTLVVIPCAHITLRRADLKRLRGVRWLNDEIVNSYVALINQRNSIYKERAAAAAAATASIAAISSSATAFGASGRSVEPDLRFADVTSQRPNTYVFNTYFYTRMTSCGYDYLGVARWTRRARIDVLIHDLILVPVNLGNYHWILTGIDMRNKCFLYLDSMHGRDSNGVIDNLKSWLGDEVRHKHGAAQAEHLQISSWAVLTNKFFLWSSDTNATKKLARQRIPKQRDGGSCGVFTAKIADCLAMGSKVYFGHPNIKLIRYRMALDLYRRLLPG
jgi:Ulp1 protease family, C-terminal catalytic domain